MISTVTTTTVTTATVAFAAGLSLMAILMLLGMLISKEVVSASDQPRFKALGRALNVAVVPLLLAFTLIAVIQVLSVLQ